MAHQQLYRKRFLSSLGTLWLMASSVVATAERTDWVAHIDKQWGFERYRDSEQSVQGFPIPLGPMEKQRGSWRLKRFEPFFGELQRTTWQFSGGSVVEIYETLRAELAADYDLAYQCSDRGCGNASEWASRVYNERLLYGRDEFMRYAAFRTPEGGWLTLFTAARTADRQYLHLDVARPEE